MVSYYPSKFGDHWHSGSRDIMVFVSHETLQNHEIKPLSDFIVRSPSHYPTILPSLVAISHSIVDT